VVLDYVKIRRGPVENMILRVLGTARTDRREGMEIKEFAI